MNNGLAYLNSSVDAWGQRAFNAAGKKMWINIDPQLVGVAGREPAAQVCGAALKRKELFAKELLAIAQAQGLAGFILDWEDGTGNSVACFTALWGYVATVLNPAGIKMASSIDNSNHLGPLDANSTSGWSVEWDYISYIKWASVLVNMGSCELVAARCILVILIRIVPSPCHHTCACRSGGVE